MADAVLISPEGRSTGGVVQRALDEWTARHGIALTPQLARAVITRLNEAVGWLEMITAAHDAIVARAHRNPRTITTNVSRSH
jgi:hypothetical protein